jgi:hypothetical protein
MGQDGFYFLYEKDVLRIIFALENPTASAGYQLGYQKPACYL